MEAGYDPNLVLELRRHTVGAIDTLTRFRSTDPAAAEAMRTIRLTRRNLEDHWMAALRDMQVSLASVVGNVAPRFRRSGHGQRRDRPGQP